MNLEKLKSNAKKIKKLSTPELLALYKLVDIKIKSLTQEYEKGNISIKEYKSWEIFLDEIMYRIDNRN